MAALLAEVCQLHREMVPGAQIVERIKQAVREVLVDLDDEARRLVWSIVDGPYTHHNGAAQVFADGEDGARFVWVADLLPDALAVMNRYSTLHIVVRDNALQSRHISGVFRIGDVDTEILVVERYFGLRETARSADEIVLER